MKKLLARKARVEKTFCGEAILKNDDTSCWIYSNDIKALGTQKICGRNGVEIVVKYRECGEAEESIFIIPACWNTKEANKLKKVLAGKRRHEINRNPISIIWAEPAEWIPAVDSL